MAATLDCLVLPASCVPAGDRWLSATERGVLAGLRFPKRRADWRLGRWVAKRAIGAARGREAGPGIEILTAPSGAPEARVHGAVDDPPPLSISHAGGWGACVVGRTRSARIGCDLEVVARRSPAFVRDYFTAAEQARTAASGAERDRVACLTWSAKESCLKALRTGLRRDTRSVELIRLDAPGRPWASLAVRDRESDTIYAGWWRGHRGLVLTVVADDPNLASPVELLERLRDRPTPSGAGHRTTQTP